MKIAHEEVRERIDRFWNLKRRSGERDDLIGIADRQEFDDDLLHETKDCRVRADAEGQGQHCRGGKSRGFCEQPERIGKIFADVLQETNTARVAALLRCDGHGAERATRRIAGVALGHSCRSVFFRELLQVDREFLLEIILDLRSPEDGPESLAHDPCKTHGSCPPDDEGDGGSEPRPGLKFAFQLSLAFARE